MITSNIYRFPQKLCVFLGGNMITSNIYRFPQKLCVFLGGNMITSNIYRFPQKLCVFLTPVHARIFTLFGKQIQQTMNGICCKNDDISSTLKFTFPKYFTRAIRREFMNLYGQICDAKPAVLREICLTGDHTALTNEQEKEIHQV